jgi:hypothetical protein
MCNCIHISFQQILPTQLALIEYDLLASGVYNGQNYFQFDYFGTTYYIFYVGGWVISTILGSETNLAELKAGDCPVSTIEDPWESDYFFVETSETNACFNPVEDRQKFNYKSIKIPQACPPQDRGFNECCCEELVLAKSTSNSWETDKTSAWLKLSDPSDTITFQLYKDGVITTYIPTAILFPNESNAYYTTIEWIDVLNSDGVGCYELKIIYNISGITGIISWGKYKLLPFTIQNALTTARIRANFDGYHEIEQIDFTGSGIESTYRFNGFIGNRQPNTEIDNIIYNNREMKRVIRENLNEFEILVDPSLKCVTKPLVDLYLLSENELYISDYNAHNHDYCINDLPVIVSQSPELTYYDFARKASLKCVVSDKFKNKRTYY